MSEENKNVRCDLCGEEVSSQNAIRFDGTILCNYVPTVLINE